MGSAHRGQRKDIYDAVFSFLLISSLVISLIFTFKFRSFLPFDTMDINIAIFVILIFLSGNIEGFYITLWEKIGFLIGLFSYL